MPFNTLIMTAEGSLWYYAPNKIAPIVFAVLFFISGIMHVYQACRYKCWKMTLFLPWGCAVLAAGYVTRAVGARDYDDLVSLAHSRTQTLP